MEALQHDAVDVGEHITPRWLRTDGWVLLAIANQRGGSDHSPPRKNIMGRTITPSKNKFGTILGHFSVQPGC